MLAGMADQALHPAEALGQGPEADLLQAARGRLQAAHVEADHAAEAGHLAFGQRVLRVVGQAGVIDLLHLLLLLQPAGDLQRVLVVPLHAQGQRLDAAQGQPAVERAGHGADGVAEKVSRSATASLLVSTGPPTMSECR
jgi:hypothetical protein